MKTGKIIRDIRLSKGIKSGFLYDSILSKQAAIKFENGTSDTTVSKFILILNRLNITLEEFEEMHIKNNTSDFYYTGGYIKLFYKKDIEGMKKLIEEATILYNSTSNIKYYHYASLMKLLLAYLNEDEPCLKSRDIIIEYLLNCEEWGYYEITLFTNSLIYLPKDFIDSIYYRVKKRINGYSKLLRYRNETAIMILNILEKNIIEKDVKNIKYYLLELQHLKNDTLDNMYIQSMIKYFTILVTSILTKDFNINNEKQINKIIDFLYFIEVRQKAEQCQTFYIKVKKIYTQINET